MREVKEEVWKNVGQFTQKVFAECFGNCENQDGILVVTIDDLGSTEESAMIEIIPESGFYEGDDQVILHFYTTFSEGSQEQEDEDIPYSLNAINQLISSDTLAMYGHFGFFEPIRQIYHSYRLPVDGDKIENSRDSIEHFARTLSEEIDLMSDLVQLIVRTPGRLTVNECLNYLQKLMDEEDDEEE